MSNIIGGIAILVIVVGILVIIALAKNINPFKIRKYAKDEVNRPMTFFKFYVYVRAPLMFLLTLMSLDEQSDLVYTTIDFARASVLCVACIGLHNKQYWGYILNKCFLIAEIVLVIAYVILEASLGMGAYGNPRILIFSIISLVYFEKRKLLFEKTPCPENNNQSGSKAPYTEETSSSTAITSANELPLTKEIHFAHTCSNCRKHFKVKYKMPENKTDIPKLSVTCPQCKTKEIVTVDTYDVVQSKQL
ncbi:MAG: hypothetical protein PUD92_04145 [Clostridiales bacterium]|nr:hypothetical protein [Clostridiales bacterium]